MVQFYGYKKCGTSNKGEKFLLARGVTYRFVDITTCPPSRNELATYITKSGKSIQAFFNTSGLAYKEGNIKALLPTLSEDQKIDLLASNGRLIKRPIVTDGIAVTVGFRDEEFEKHWK